MLVLFFVFWSMVSLAPGREHAENAVAIAEAALEGAPFFRDDESRLKTAALMVSIAFRESSFHNNITGDKGRARCMFQLWAAPREVLSDPRLCARLAIERIRASIRACGAGNELGEYAAGPGGCASERAKRISRDRVALARQLRKASAL